MPKRATKAAANAFYKARMNAASYNDRLASREGAADVTGIDRNRIAYTELGTANPYPEEVLIYADAYNAPELLNYYCSMLCPIGRETVDELEVSSLERVCLKLLASTQCIEEVREGLIAISEDGVIDSDERGADGGYPGEAAAAFKRYSYDGAAVQETNEGGVSNGGV